MAAPAGTKPVTAVTPARRSRLRRVTKIAGWLAIPALLVTFCVGPPSYYSAKYAPAGPARPRPYPDEILPEKQVEPHTCGFHSLSSLYKAYGLDPDRQRLRFRLGVDKPFTNLLSDSLGTIHPDMFRVLEQDGFDPELVRPSSADSAARLEAHLESGHMAVGLIRVNELHWVVLASHRGDAVVVCDSLKEHTYEEPLRTYLRDRLYSIVLVKPSVDGP